MGIVAHDEDMLTNAVKAVLLVKPSGPPVVLPNPKKDGLQWTVCPVAAKPAFGTGLRAPLAALEHEGAFRMCPVGGGTLDIS